MEELKEELKNENMTESKHSPIQESVLCGSGGRDRTADLGLMSPTL